MVQKQKVIQRVSTEEKSSDAAPPNLESTKETLLKSLNEGLSVDTQKEEDLGKISVYSVNFTRMELAHLRDLFSVKLPPEMTVTISEALAETQSRTVIESKLWQKLLRVMVDAMIPTQDEAPDFTILPSGPPPLGVFQVESTDSQLRTMIAQASGIPLDNEDEE